MARFVLVFVAVLALLFGVEMLNPVQVAVVHPWTNLLARMSAAGLAWLVAGGLAYTAGAIVFMFDHRVRYAHAVWHGFVLLGSVCHFFAALWHAV